MEKVHNVVEFSCPIEHPLQFPDLTNDPVFALMYIAKTFFLNHMRLNPRAHHNFHACPMYSPSATHKLEVLDILNFAILVNSTVCFRDARGSVFFLVTDEFRLPTSIVSSPCVFTDEYSRLPSFVLVFGAGLRAAKQSGRGGCSRGMFIW